MNTGTIQLDYPQLPATSFVIDFEGAPVGWSVPYHVESELIDASGSVLARDATDVISSPFR